MEALIRRDEEVRLIRGRPSVLACAIATRHSEMPVASTGVHKALYINHVPRPPRHTSQHEKNTTGIKNKDQEEEVAVVIDVKQQSSNCAAPASPSTPPLLSPAYWPHSDESSCSLLPLQSGYPRKTLVLDLDLTLIECLTVQSQGSYPPDFIYTDCERCRAQVWKRPHLMEFLQTVSKDFEVVLFTAAGQRHADAVLSEIDPRSIYIHHRLYGHHTVPSSQWGWVKDLSRIGRDLSQTVIVDDCEFSALFHRQNWISIVPFRHGLTGMCSDTSLLDILNFLRLKILGAVDVREALSEHYDQERCSPRMKPTLGKHYDGSDMNQTIQWQQQDISDGGQVGGQQLECLA